MERKNRHDIERYSKVRNLPSPVRQGMYEMAIKAFDKHCPHFEHPIVLRGLILHPIDSSKSWKMKARGVEVWFKWWMDALPPKVVAGKRYTIIGDLLTANLGSKFSLRDCVLVPSGHQKFSDELELLFQKYCIDINTYVERPTSDTFFIKE